MNYKYGIITLLLLCGEFTANANKIYREYIATYSSLAQEQMRKYKIPASITLAQALLESGAGKGRLATQGNNHFGIKCHEWKGKRIYHDDDARGECFRKYNRVEESFEDHSKFLAHRPRYSELFKLSPQDYKGWAKGLKKAGYATDPNYANKLIKLIEEYDLYRYDRSTATKKSSKKQVLYPHNTYIANNLLYVVARKGDTFYSISDELGISARRLANYNELPKDIPLAKGDIVYLEKKNRKASKNFKLHKIRSGESMHSIAQRYGIRIKYLYKMNNKDHSYVPNNGDVLRLR